MDKLNFNRFFRLHTVTGIVISVALYIIFFAGAFTLFRTEIRAWENEETIAETTATNEFGVMDINLDLILRKLDSTGYSVYDRDFYMRKENSTSFYVLFFESKDSLSVNRGANELLITQDFNKSTFSIKEIHEKYNLDRLFYLLHFFFQLGGLPVYYLAGFVSFFFLFAIVTGVIVHWKKMVSNFYVFRPFAKLKTVWTDAHTVLGMIGLPFQFMYALTGAMFCLGLLIKPLGNMLPESITDKNTIEIINNKFRYTNPEFTNSVQLIHPFLDSLKTSWKDFQTKSIRVAHYGNQNSTITVSGVVKKEKRFYHNAQISYDFATDKITSLADPNNLSYTKSVYEVAGNLHHAEFGNVGVWTHHFLKIVYFILSLITCFVIITGVLIWLTARDKKNVPEKQRCFNEQVGAIYLAITLTLFPITALVFIASKLIPENFNPERKLILNWVFFGGWLLSALFFWFKKNNYFTNKYTLLLGGVLGLCIPLVNGFSSGNWIWRTFLNKNYDVFVFDVLWLSIGALSVFAVFQLRKKN
jgi:uncharacterized iron-regulated membrane protein